jgi:hypothetical protein
MKIGTLTFRDRRTRSSTCTLEGSKERHAYNLGSNRSQIFATAVFERQKYQIEVTLNQTTSAIVTEINNNIDCALHTDYINGGGWNRTD